MIMLAIGYNDYAYGRTVSKVEQVYYNSLHLGVYNECIAVYPLYSGPITCE